MKTMVSTAGGNVAPSEGPDVLPPGAKAGPWIVERELGRGGMGAVYAVVHEDIGKRAALKLVHRRLLTPGFNVERVLLEARVVNAVGHPNIVDIFETGELDDRRPYVVMERLEGQPLSDRADEGKILPDQVIAILLQICDALIAAHAANIVHRDLKLDNVFLVDNPDDPATPKVKLLDWGIAKIINQDVRHTVEGQLVGTPQYLAPEQARGAEVSPQTDVYSLGVMAFELFLEQLPFEAETSAELMAMHLRAIPPAPSELWPDIPRELEELLLQMLAKNPDNRPTMLEVARRLERVREELARRRHAEAESARGTSPPGAVSAGPIGATRLPRVRSSAGLAPTEPADSAQWPTPRRRWRYAAGALAIAASATMFVFTRAAEPQTADAAAISLPDVTTTESLAAHLVEDAPAPAPAPAPDVAPALEPRHATAAPADTAPAPQPRPAKVTVAAEEAPRVRRASKRRASADSPRASTRKAPTMPRRAAVRIDPDGTIDPYL